MSSPEINTQPDPAIPHDKAHDAALDPAVFNAWREGDHDAGATIVVQYRKFVGMVAANYRGNALDSAGGTIDESDLRQVGEWSIARQAKRFDHARDINFLSFAGEGVRGAILREYFHSHGAVHIPQHRMNLFLPFRRERARRQLAGEPPLAATEIADLLSLSLDIQGSAIATSIDTPVTVPNFCLSVALVEASSLDAIMEESPDLFESAVSISSDHSLALSTEEAAGLSVARDRLATLIEEAFTVRRKDFDNPKRFGAAQRKLSREKRVILSLFGFETGSTRTLTEVGEDLGLSHEGVRRIRVAAIARLKETAKFGEFAGLEDEIF